MLQLFGRFHIPVWVYNRQATGVHTFHRQANFTKKTKDFKNNLEGKTIGPIARYDLKYYLILHMLICGHTELI